MEKELLHDLVTRVQSGDQDAAGELYLGCRDDLYYYILKTVNNDAHLAEDLLQDSFVEILETIDKLREPAAYVTWSRQIAYHRCTAYFRKRHELLADENEDGQTVFDNLEEDRTEFIPDEALEKEDLKQTIGQMINDLPEEQRSALLLRYFDELSVADIAQIQGVSEGTVKSRLNYGRKSIKSAVEAYEKKNGVKLHSLAILPLLLWFFREKTVAEGGSLTTKAATATIGKLAAPAAQGVAKTVAKESAKGAAKAATKMSAKQFIAIVLISATLSTTAAVGTTLALPEETKDKISDVFQETSGNSAADPTAETGERPTISLPTPTALPATPTAWTGFCDVSIYGSFVDLVLHSISETSVNGQLTVSYGTKTHLDTDFTGEGTEENNVITYCLTLTTPYNEHYQTPVLKYNRLTQSFELADFFDLADTTVLRNTFDIEEQSFNTGTWTGVGEGYLGDIDENSAFQLDLTYFSSTKIEGHLTVTHDGIVIHDLYFSGRGRPDVGKMSYCAVVTASGVPTDDREEISLVYNGDTDTFSVKIYALSTIPVSRAGA